MIINSQGINRTHDDGTIRDCDVMNGKIGYCTDNDKVVGTAPFSYTGRIAYALYPDPDRGIHNFNVSDSLIGSKILDGNKEIQEVSLGDTTVFKVTEEASLPASMYCRAACYGGDKFVVIGYNSDKAAYSTDGINWTATTMPSSAYWEQVCYGDGKFVAMITSSTNKAAYSTDGITWTETTLPKSGSYQSLCYVDGKFVAVSSSTLSYSIYSTDGINWTMDFIGNFRVLSLCYADGKFVATTHNTIHKIIYCTDITAKYTVSKWTSALKSKVGYLSIYYIGGRFIAIGLNDIAYSTDGISWTCIEDYEIDVDYERVYYCNDKIVTTRYIDYNHKIPVYSTDGIEWKRCATCNLNNNTRLCYGNGKLIALPWGHDKVLHLTEEIRSNSLILKKGD